jgi:hypothetical protein
VIERDRADPDLHLTRPRRRRPRQIDNSELAIVEKLERTHQTALPKPVKHTYDDRGRWHRA